MTAFLGIDTSNYTTSAAVLQTPGGLFERRQPLSVVPGERGLRQNDAVFQHVKALPPLLEALPLAGLAAVGASVCPGGRENSYMPCFKVGEGAARAAAAAAGVPFFGFTHQAGHIAAALLSLDKLSLLARPLLAFHVSGGTTEAVLAEPDAEAVLRCTTLARSLDLKAGQAVDRVGLMLGLPFPCGPALEQLAVKSTKPLQVQPCFKADDFCLSGVENQCAEMLARREPPEDVAAYCLAFLAETLARAAERLCAAHPGLPVVFAGGVMSDTLIRRRVSGSCDALFAREGYSADNAAGIAALTGLRAGGAAALETGTARPDKDSASPKTAATAPKTCLPKPETASMAQETAAAKPGADAAPGRGAL